MDRDTKEYREAQFKKVETEHFRYKTIVKFAKPDGETKWMNIENDEFEKIKNILLGGAK